MLREAIGGYRWCIGDTGEASARVGIVADMLNEAARREPQPDGATRAPEPSVRPSAHAQWDEVRACWIEWDDDVGEWVRVGDAAPNS